MSLEGLIAAAVGGAVPEGPESVLVVPPSTACKHGRYECDACGTSDRRDAVHTTQGGAGKIARLRRSTKP